MKSTSIILSPVPVLKQFDGWDTLNHVSTFSSLEDLHAERIAALLKVTTEFCAYIDDDDELPENTGAQISEIMKLMQDRNSNIAYTDYIENSISGSVRKSPGDYVRAKHICNPLWMHHLVVMRTDAAQIIAKTLPIGLYWTESLLYLNLAKHNPIYYPNVAYTWNRKETGMHSHKDITRAQINSVQYCLSKKK